MANSEDKKLTVDVIARIDKLEKGMAKASAVSSSTFSKIESRSAKFTERMRESGKSAFEGLSSAILPAGAGILGVAAAIEGAKSALEGFDKIGKEAKATGLSAEDFQALAYAAKLGGVETDQFGVAMETFAKNSGLAEAGTGRLVTQLKHLDPALLQSLQTATNQHDRLLAVADAFDHTSDASKKAAISNALFGEAGAHMVEVLKGGSAALDETTAKARALGLVVSNEVVASAEDLNDRFTTATSILDTQFKTTLVDLAPALVSTTELIAGLARAISSVLDSMKDLQDRSSAGLKDRLSEINMALAANAPGPDLSKVPIGGLIPTGNPMRVRTHIAAPDVSALQAEKAQIQAILADRDKAVITTPTGSSGSASTATSKQIDQVQKLISTLQFEQSEMGKSARQRAIDNELRQAGAAATGAQRDQITELVGANYDLQASQDAVNQKMADMRDLAKSVFQGIISDIGAGKDAANVLADALGNVGNKLLDLATTDLFGGGGSGSGGGLLDSLFQSLAGGSPGRAGGGPVTAGRPYIVGEKRPELFVPNTAGRIIPDLSTPRAAGGAVVVNYSPQIDARGADSSAVAALATAQARDRAEFESRVIGTIRQAKRQRKL